MASFRWKEIQSPSFGLWGQGSSFPWTSSSDHFPVSTGLRPCWLTRPPAFCPCHSLLVKMLPSRWLRMYLHPLATPSKVAIWSILASYSIPVLCSMLLIFSCLVSHLFVSPSCMYTPWEQAPGWFCAWLWPQGPAQGPPHTKCCPVWNLILPRLQANELAFGSCMGAGRRHETRRLEIKDLIPPKTSSSMCVPGFSCS